MAESRDYQPRLRAGQRGYAWFRLVHPFPSLLVTTAAVLCATIFSHAQLSPFRLALVACSMLCMQAAIGSANDVMDRALDRSSKPWKPIARGAIAPREAALLAWVLSAACLLLAWFLGWQALLAAGLGLLCGLLYDLRLKRTRWSWLPYCFALPTVPVFAWAAAHQFVPRLFLVYPLGVLLGLALHLANTLPDLDADRAFGVRGLAHALGRRRTLLLCYGSLLLAQLLALTLALLLGTRGPAFPAGMAVSLALTAASMLYYRLRPTTAALQVNFGVLALAVLALSVGWLSGTMT